MAKIVMATVDINRNGNEICDLHTDLGNAEASAETSRLGKLMIQTLNLPRPSRVRGA
jgi:hypothetical protein